MFASRYIIQFSPPRTGSTLLWNVMRQSFPKYQIYKQHGLTQAQFDSDVPIVSSIRNPLDVIVSSLERYRLEATDENVRAQLSEMERFGMNKVSGLQQRANTLILQYECFYNNFDYLFQRLEVFFSEPIPHAVRTKIECEFSLENVERKSLRLGDFCNYDKVDNIHGRHISKSRGVPGQYRQVLSSVQIALIRERFHEIFRDFEIKSS
jgi:hypothetical protein